MFIDSPRRSILTLTLPPLHLHARVQEAERRLREPPWLYPVSVVLVCTLGWLLATEVVRVIGFGGFYGVPFALCAVAIAAWLGGLGAGLATAALSVAMLYVLLPSMRIMDVQEESAWHLTVFSLVAIIISSFEAAVRAQHRRDAREKEMRDEFLAIVSHELRTPVTVISGSANLLGRLWERLDPEDRHDVLDSLQEESARLTRMIEDLLLLARIEDGRDVVNEPLLLQRSLQRSVATFRHLFPRRDVELSLAEEDTVILGSETYFDAVLRNVLSNAHRFSPIDAPLEVSIGRDHAKAVVLVRDHGPGVSKQLIEEIYEPYFHGQPVSDGTRGIGLGLALCKRAMESMGGTIKARTLDEGGLEVALSFRLEDGSDD
jgi:K+-sensing histidine kinase KdpD